MTGIVVNHIFTGTMVTRQGITHIYCSFTVNSSVARVALTGVVANIVRAVSMDTGK